MKGNNLSGNITWEESSLSLEQRKDYKSFEDIGGKKVIFENLCFQKKEIQQ